MIAVARAAAFDAFSPLCTEMAFAEGRMTADDITPSSGIVHDLRIRVARSGEALMRLTAEWMLRQASDAEIDPILVTIEPDDFRPLLARAYAVLWRDMPDTPAPHVLLLRPETGDWDALRFRLYGGVQHDIARLRPLAEATELLDGAGRIIDPQRLG